MVKWFGLRVGYTWNCTKTATANLVKYRKNWNMIGVIIFTCHMFSCFSGLIYVLCFYVVIFLNFPLSESCGAYGAHMASYGPCKGLFTVCARPITTRTASEASGINTWAALILSSPFVKFVGIWRIFGVHLFIIINMEIWNNNHCLRLGHETMVCAVCLAMLLLLFRPDMYGPPSNAKCPSCSSRVPCGTRTCTYELTNGRLHML